MTKEIIEPERDARDEWYFKNILCKYLQMYVNTYINNLNCGIFVI
jgi:hypothetical protein